jgi:hypothetical protein
MLLSIPPPPKKKSGSGMPEYTVEEAAELK